MSDDGRVGYVCPHCKAKVRASPSLTGKKADCPRCGLEVRRWPQPKSSPPRARGRSPRLDADDDGRADPMPSRQLVGIFLACLLLAVPIVLIIVKYGNILIGLLILALI